MSNKNNNKNKNEEINLKENPEDNSLNEKQSLEEKTTINEIPKEDLSNEASDDNETPEKSEEDILREELEHLRDERLRLLAEMENLRKRSEKEKIDSIKYGSFNFAKDILQLDDNLSRALESIPEDEALSGTVKNLVEGLRMVQKDFTTIIERHGIKRIKALNEKFDHNFHQAMLETESKDVEEGVVTQEIQSGYTMHDRLLRPSMVGVSKKPNKKEKKD
tara:strand:- start:27 stop:686 length:660 start_codon:yes stop_codon:yes gene_type:complete